MSIIYWVFVPLILSYLFTNIYFVFYKKTVSSENKIKKPLKKISVVIALKNESSNIPALINSLQKQEYPDDNYEVILVDDGSTDNTFDLIQSCSKNFDNIKVFKIKDKVSGGKKKALTYGIGLTNHPCILITDGDCIPQPGWLQAYSNKFSSGFDMLFGIAPYFAEKTLLNKIIQFENLRTHILTFNLARLGFPYSAAARNFGFNKKLFYQIGGYQNTLELESGDDDLLIREAVRKRRNIGVIDEDNSYVFTHGASSLRDYFIQKARHTSTSNYYLLKNKLILGFWHAINLIFLALLVPGIFLNSIFLIPFFSKIINGYPCC